MNKALKDTKEYHFRLFGFYYRTCLYIVKTSYLCIRSYHFILESMSCLHPSFCVVFLELIALHIFCGIFLGHLWPLLSGWNFLFVELSFLCTVKCFELIENVYLSCHFTPKVIFLTFFLQILKQLSIFIIANKSLKLV